jgi:aryl carrier-like protein
MSSISGTIGSRGQGNYAATNTFLDAFVQYRLKQGLTACVIDVGRMAGSTSDGSSSLVDSILQSQSVRFIDEDDILVALHLAIIRSKQLPPSGELTTPFVCKNHLTIGLRSSRLLSDPSNRIPWKRDLRMSITRNLDGSAVSTADKNKQGVLGDLLAQIESDDTILETKSTSETITGEIGRCIYALMLQPSDDLDVKQSLDSLGVDSLVTIEIRNWWRRTLGFEVSTLEILNASTIQGLGELAMQGLQAKFKK